MHLQQLNRKLFLAAYFVLAAVLVAEDATSYLTADVARVGARLACRCGGCRNTVGDCPMLRCGSADPLRHRISTLKSKGMSDDAIVSDIVREQGIVALASPPGRGLGPIVTWVMPGLVLVLGFGIYSAFVKRHSRKPAPLSQADEFLISRYRDQMERELDDDK